MTLREHIAKSLMQSRIGLTRKELTEKIDPAEYNGNADRISDQLFYMQKANHVEKSGGFNNAASRWAITSKGRAYYSALNNDETDNQTQPAEADTIPPVSVDHRAESDTTSSQEIQETVPVSTVVLDFVQEPIPQQTHTQYETPTHDQLVSDAEMARAVIAFNNAKKNLDQSFSNLLSLIIDVASQQPDTIAIENKSQALALLETLETNDLYSGQHRATFARIRQAVELMEDAA